MSSFIQKIYLLIICLFIIIGFSSPPVDSGPMVTWYDIRPGFANAQRLNKWIVVDVYTKWCGWCKKLEHDTFEDPAVEQLLSQSFVCVRANAEDNDIGQQMATDFEVHGFPTILIFDPQGKIKAKHSGYLTATQFLQVMANFKDANHIQ